MTAKQTVAAGKGAALTEAIRRIGLAPAQGSVSLSWYPVWVTDYLIAELTKLGYHVEVPEGNRTLQVTWSP